MDDRFKSIIAVYLVLLGCALAVVSMKEDDYRSRASRADLKITTLELKVDNQKFWLSLADLVRDHMRESGQTIPDFDEPYNHGAIIRGMNDLRNQARAKAEQFEAAALMLTISLVIGSLAALFAAPIAFIPLIVSWIVMAGAWYFVWLAW